MWKSVLECWQEIAATMEAWVLRVLQESGRVDLARVEWRSAGGDRGGLSLAQMTRRPRWIGYGGALLLMVGFGG